MTETKAPVRSDALCAEQLCRFADKSGWYHSIELAPGIVTRGAYDHTPFLAHYSFPESLEGWTVLDVGTSEGFFAFEFERRGAAEVLAIDTDRFDGTPAVSPSAAHVRKYVEKYRKRAATNDSFEFLYHILGVPLGHHTLAAATLRQSHIRFKNHSVYELDRLDRKYDLVFCGDLLTHLKDPITAVEQLAKATGRLCIIALPDVLPVPNDPSLPCEKHCQYVGNTSGGAFFHFTPECLREMLLASGFATAEIVSRFALPDSTRKLTNPHAVLHCTPTADGVNP